MSQPSPPSTGSGRRPTTQPPNHPTTQLPNWLSVVLLLFLFALLVFSIQDKSPTLDEQNHIARGLAYLKTGDLRLSQEHPPLINVWEAWPLLLDPGIKLPLDSPSWANAEWYGFADQLLWRTNDGATRDQMVFAARVPVMWLTLLLAALVYRWGKALGSAWAGLLTMVVLVFDPNILAHGRLVTTDTGITCLSVAAMYALWAALRYVENATYIRWAVAGAVLGLALVSKFSALVLGPVTLIAVFLAYLGQKSGFSKKSGFWPWIVRLALLYGVGFVTIWAVYSFQWGPITLLGGLPGPMPSYFAGIQTILQRTGGGSTAFLMGQLSDRGWWYYFPVALAIKTPLPTLALLAFAAILAVKRQIANYKSQITNHTSHSSLTPYSLLLIPPLAFWAMALTGGFNIGYRHILPSLPFLYMWAGWEIASYKSQIANRKSAIYYLAFVVCYLLFAICFFPHYLTFFNVFAGGPERGYRFLVDSNLDWGQDLPELAQDYDDRSGEPVYLSWFGAAHPEAYGFDFHPLPGFWRFGGDPAAYGFNPFAPGPGRYAISASNLQGIKLADPNTYAWFRAQKPFYDINHSILIYEVPEPDPPHGACCAVVLAVPTTQLADTERALLAEGAQVRQFDPASGVIVPAMDEVWYILPESLGWGEVVREGPGYVAVRGTPSLHTPAMYSSPMESSPLSVQFGEFVRMQYQRVENLSLSAGRPLTVQVEWQVNEPPHRAATSFAHLLDAEGRYVAGWDGLTALATCWQPGDVIVQNYAISLPADLRPGIYQIEVGWYDAETLARWLCTVDGEVAGNRWLIPDVAIGD
ncbi:MAG: glycosyltransferase family 39 protein [Anaerolineae bacterium]|nr:glycosyltransferase family 39 protein [Anaerolineae bacterium]